MDGDGAGIWGIQQVIQHSEAFFRRDFLIYSHVKGSDLLWLDVLPIASSQPYVASVPAVSNLITS